MCLRFDVRLLVVVFEVELLELILVNGFEKIGLFV